MIRLVVRSQVLGQHAVIAFVGLGSGCIAGARDLLVHEVVAECVLQGGESLPGDEGVAGEAKPEHGAAFGGNGCEFVGAEAGRCLPGAAEAERQARLAQYRCNHRVVEQHCESETAGEAHADEPDAWAAVVSVEVAGKGPQPGGGGGGVPGGKDVELSAHARLGDHAEGTPR